MLDYLGYTLYAYRKEDAAEIIVGVIKEIGGKPESTISYEEGVGVWTKVKIYKYLI